MPEKYPFTVLNIFKSPDRNDPIRWNILSRKIKDLMKGMDIKTISMQNGNFSQGYILYFSEDQFKILEFFDKYLITQIYHFINFLQNFNPNLFEKTIKFINEIL